MSTALLKDKVGVHVTSRGPYIVTYTGKKFYPMSIRPSDIDIKDIAHALSLQCRFGGHTKVHYSVAEHSLIVSRILPDDLKLRGLLHDASEAYLIDLPRPLKKLGDFTAYRRIERETQRVIYKKYGLDPDADPPEIHEADNLALATEAKHLMGDPFWAKAMPKLPFAIYPSHPHRVEEMFLDEFKKLVKINKG